MKVYLASWFHSKDIMRNRATELEEAGINVTSRWIDETVDSQSQIKDVKVDYLRETAQIDLHDILLADTVVLHVPSKEDLDNSKIPISSWARGGRHFEAGFHYATMMYYSYLPGRVWNRGPRRLILVGHRENVFHHLDNIRKNGTADDIILPTIDCFSTWEEAKNHLIEIHKSYEITA